jgi:hypothetical protein
MKLIIEIDETDYRQIRAFDEGVTAYQLTLRLYDAVSNGTPLPKGHGDLIERDKLEYLKAIHDAKYGHISWIDAIEKIKHSAPTIIEADKAEGSEE